MNAPHNTESPTKTKYLYIASRGHSGSTLLDILLGSHPKMVAMGEVEKMSLQFARDNSSKYLGLCSCGERPMNCSTWGEVAAAVKNQYGVNLSTNPFGWRVSDVGWEEDKGIRAPFHWALHYLSRFMRLQAYSSNSRFFKYVANAFSHHKKWAKNRHFVAETVRKLNHALISIDASKDALGMRDIYEANRSTTKIVFLTRDVRAVVWSYIKHKPTTDEIDIPIMSWVKVNAKIVSLLSGIPEQDRYHLKYEDLCAAPEKTLRNLCEFIGCEYDPAMLDLSRHDNHTIGGNKIRYSKVGTIREDLSWQDNLNEKDLHRIKDVAGKLAKELGYIL